MKRKWIVRAALFCAAICLAACGESSSSAKKDGSPTHDSVSADSIGAHDGLTADSASDGTPQDAIVKADSRRADSTPPVDVNVLADSAPPADGAIIPDASSSQAIIDIRADTNRDGVVDLVGSADDLNEDKWDAKQGAIFLANLDDDTKRCPQNMSRAVTSDAELAACNDGADNIVNGADDLLDMAPLKVAAWPAAPTGSSGAITLSLPKASGVQPRDVVRLFIKRGGSYSEFTSSDSLSTAELRQGVELALEGRDIVRDDTKWDGYVDVTLKVTYGTPAVSGEDKLRMRVAPLLTSHHLQPVETAFVTGTSGSDSVTFRSQVGAAITAANVPQGMVQIGTDDQWTQDFFETGWMSMPAAGGKQHVITVYIRSANVEFSGNFAPLRFAGRVVFLLRGKDVAAVQQYTLNKNGDMGSLDSFGNTETVPPYSFAGQDYPLGRILRGSVSNFYPDITQTRMYESQRVQVPLTIDTSWLLVGHVDETVSFVKAKTPRGWVMLVNDATLAKKMLQDAQTAGHGQTQMFVGQSWIDDWGVEFSAATTINAVLADTEVMGDSAKAATEVAAQEKILKAATGITDAEIIRVPFLHYPVSGYSLAYQPGTINGMYASDGDFLAPDPHGPVINGVDIFKKQLTDELAKVGVKVTYIEDWNLYHRLAGEVHCGTNSQRALPQGVKWWETNR